MRFCPFCGAENNYDAKYCEECGRSLQKNIHKRNVVPKDDIRERSEKKGMSSNMKVLIVICIVLIAGLGVAVGMLYQKPSQIVLNTQPNNDTQTDQNNNSNPDQPTWHKVAVYTGPGEDFGSFTIKGNQFKVTMSAVPMSTYNTNYLDVYVYRGSSVGLNMVNSGTLSWTETEDPIKKETSIIVSEGSGVYTLDIIPTDIDSYAVTVWDYY